jgi:hypothetical protein
MIRTTCYRASIARMLTGRALAVLCLAVSLLVITARAQQSSQGPLSNLSVIKLVKAGFKEKTVIAIINNRPNHFRLDAEQLIELKQNGVSENIILAMLSQDSSFVADEYDWANDPFFGSSNKKAGNGDSNSQGAGGDIFGSSGGSNSQSRSRGAKGGTENEGNITGSATVRIIRPPSEAGGAPIKLERTAAMTNEEVIRLVEAGFSEGTIIKRIENSSADFDLSPAKLDELHKRRVTEPIIAAMSAAMGNQE